ncbi:MAG: hypothetical protein PHC73_03045, partial [Immundisolibacter sp.]
AVVYWGAPLLANAGRRLQLAAAAAQCLMVCFGTGPADGAGYAALRLAVTAADGRLRVTVLRCRGRRAGHSLLHGDMSAEMGSSAGRKIPSLEFFGSLQRGARPRCAPEITVSRR